MNRIIFFLYATLIIFHGCSNSKSIFLQTRKEELTNPAKNSPEFLLVAKAVRNFDISKIEVAIKVDTIQKQERACLEFSIIVRNKFDSALILKNIADFIKFELKNTDGDNILFPIASKGYINVALDNDNLNNSFVFEKMIINNQVKDSSFLKKEYITIPANGNLEMFITVRKVIKPGATRPYYIGDGVTKILKGKYLFLLSVPIYVKTTAFLMVLSPALDIKLL